VDAASRVGLLIALDVPYVLIVLLPYLLISRKILISGPDGAYLARLLLDKGYEVLGTSSDAQIGGFANLVRLGVRDQVRLESVAANDFRSVLNVLRRTDPHEIYNLAGQSSVGLSFEQPVETPESMAVGTINLLEAIRFLEAGRVEAERL
jgi:GDPmannose 4,6-dehydratase